jgi:hypothetical protein
MHMRILPLLLAVLMQAAAAQAPAPSTDAASFTTVRVTGLRAIPWKSYRAMRAAVAAYEHYKFLAPDTVFRFAVMPPPGMTLPPDFKLRVRTEDGKELPITLVNGELFQLPELPDPKADADLVSNFKGGPLRIGLLVHTIHVPTDQERLGDVRLRNEINLAIADVDHPSDDPRCMRGRRNAIECKRPRFAVWYKPRAVTSGAWIIDGNRKEPLEASDDAAYPSYRMPISAGHFSNDAIIEFAYTKPLGPIKFSEVAIYDATD